MLLLCKVESCSCYANRPLTSPTQSGNAGVLPLLSGEGWGEVLLQQRTNFADQPNGNRPEYMNHRFPSYP